MPKFRVTDTKRKQARSLRESSTGVEEKLWRLLRSRRLAGAKFRRQVPLGPWIADFVSFEHKLIVEADGSQHADNERDRVRDADLKARGFRVLRFWNNEILQTPNGVLEAIWAALQEAPSPGGLRPPPSPTRGEG